MNQETSSGGGKDRFAYAVAALWVVLFVFHALKGLGLNPVVLPDEYSYALAVRFRGPGEAAIPNYLFYALFGLTNGFVGFLDAARVMNAFFYMLSFPFVYRIARLVCSRPLALFLAVLIMVWPISGYTLYFMPESVYFLAFWAFAWMLLRCDDVGRPFVSGLKAGAGIGVLTLLKVHGMFLLPGYALYLAAATPRYDRAAFVRRLAVAGLGCLAAFLAVRLGGGWLFAGPAGLKLFGASYGSLAQKGLALADLPRLVWNSAFNLFGNLSALSALLALPVAIALSRVAYAETEGTRPGAGKIAALAFAFIAPLMAVTAVFCGMLAFVIPDTPVPEEARIQWRYYNFLLPLFLILLGGAYERMRGAGSDGGKKPSWAVCLPPVLLAAYVAATAFSAYHTFIIPDAPELCSPYYRDPLFLRLLAGSTALLCLAWRFFPKKAVFVCLFVFTPIYTVVTSAAGLGDVVEVYREDNIYDLAGKATKNYLGRETAFVTVVAPDENFCFRALFHIDDGGADALALPHGPLDMSAVPAGKKWLLAVGDYEAPESASRFNLSYELPVPDDFAAYLASQDMVMVARFVLHRLADFDYSASLDAAGHAWPVEKVTRLGGQTIVRYGKTLPAEMTVRLVGKTPDIDPDAVFLVSFGDAPPVEIGLSTAAADRPAVVLSDGEETIVNIRMKGGQLMPDTLELEMTPVQSEPGS